MYVVVNTAICILWCRESNSCSKILDKLTNKMSTFLENITILVCTNVCMILLFRNVYFKESKEATLTSRTWTSFGGKQTLDSTQFLKWDDESCSIIVCTGFMNLYFQTNKLYLYRLVKTLTTSDKILEFVWFKWLIIVGPYPYFQTVNDHYDNDVFTISLP